MASNMYMAHPTTAAELSRQSGSGTSWIVGGSGWENLAREDVHHQALDAAPDAALVVARRLHDALDGAILPGSESDSMGRVVVIEAPWPEGERLPERQMILGALGLKEVADEVNLLEESTMTASQPGGSCWLGHTLEDAEDFPWLDDVSNNNFGKARRVTDLMASNLEDLFEFNFSERIVCAPVLFGGRASDGNIVAILSMRVWT
ncbi:hypothetical protein ACHAWF_002602 [Thalassiosira exigua]